MLAVKGIFDGKVARPTEPIKKMRESNVIIVFIEDILKVSESERARKLLRSSAKGSNLTESLLQSRSEDLKIEEAKCYFSS